MKSIISCNVARLLQRSILGSARYDADYESIFSISQVLVKLTLLCKQGLGIPVSRQMSGSSTT